MAVPWLNPTFGQGVLPAEAPFYAPHPVDPRLIALIAEQRDQQQLRATGAIQNAIASIGKYMESRKQDEIANQLMAGSSAQRPNVVSWPSLESTGATGGQLTPDEMAQNKSLGFGTTPQTPDMGGVFGFKLRQQAAKNQYDQALNQARLEHLNALTNNTLGGGGRGGSTVSNRQYYDYTEPSTGQTVRVTGNQLTNLTRQPTQRQAAVKPDPWANLIPIGRGDYDTTTKNFTGKDNGAYIKLADAKGFTQVIPYTEYTKHRAGVGIADQPRVNEAAAALGNQAPLPQPDIPYGKETDLTHVKPAPQAMIDYLKLHPETKDQFLARYGYTP